MKEIYNALADKYGSKQGEMVFTFSDKGAMHSYIELYEQYFQSKKSSVSLLEIGMMTGGSMHLWQQYFENYNLVGIDLSPTWNQPRPFQAEVEQDPNIHLVFGVDSTQDPVPAIVASQLFDFVIDDGDHRVGSQLATFKKYWPYVKSGGVYFVEDVVDQQAINQLEKEVSAVILDNGIITNYAGRVGQRQDDRILIITKNNYEKLCSLDKLPN
jgi:cephalosporin hydroxylase